MENNSENGEVMIQHHNNNQGHFLYIKSVRKWAVRQNGANTILL